MEGKSCYDLAIDKEDIRTLLDVHLLTADTPTNGSHNEDGASTKGMQIIRRLNFLYCYV